jgi:hypothetical protein
MTQVWLLTSFRYIVGGYEWVRSSATNQDRRSNCHLITSLKKNELKRQLIIYVNVGV